MTDLRERFIEFPWIPSFVVSILSGLIFFIISNPSILPQNIQNVFNNLMRYGTFLIAVGSFGVGVLSIYFNREQRKRWDSFEQRLENKTKEERDKRISDEGDENITKTPSELLLEWIDKVENLLWISDDGEVKITGKNLNDTQKIILYLIGIRYAYELDLVDSPEVGIDEVARKTNMPFSAVIGWHVALEEVIEKKHLEIWEKLENREHDKYKLNMDNVDKAFHYVTGQEDIPDPHPMLSQMDQK